MRPTRRGSVALAIALGAVLLAAASGPRALNAVAAPLFGAVAFGAVQVWRADEPELHLHPVEPGFPGSERTFRVAVEGGGVLEVTHAWPDGLEGDGIDSVVSAPDTIETAVTLRDRGRYVVTAPTIRRRDALGLVRATAVAGGTTTILVYPELHRGAGRQILDGLLGADALAERQEFDRLREYEPGDPLRDVHWKSSAKRDGFFVTEFEPNDRAETVTIAASAEPGAADAMASATATLAVLAIETGRAVGVEIPGRRVPAAAGRSHASTILSVLAGATHGDGDVEGEAADVEIEATTDGTRITVGETTYRFAELVDETQTAHEREVVAA